jgi:hypothetical protein
MKASPYAVKSQPADTIVALDPQAPAIPLFERKMT